MRLDEHDRVQRASKVAITRTLVCQLTTDHSHGHMRISAIRPSNVLSQGHHYEPCTR